jgi:hypothetical protein
MYHNKVFKILNISNPLVIFILNAFFIIIIIIK